MNRKALTGAALLVLAGGGYALAQNVEGLDLGAIGQKAEADAAEQEAFARDVARRGEAVRGDAAQAADEAEAAAHGKLRNLRVGSDGLVDFDAIIAGATADQKEAGRAPQFIVFASLSMPAQSLKVLIRDTARAGGAVVFRGFPGNSMRAFQQGMAHVVDAQDDYGSIGIDPRLFRAFHVDAVPTFVAVSSDLDLCDGFACETAVPAYDRMSGNVTVEHVLETFAEGRGPGAAVAAVALKRMGAPGI